MAKKSKRKQDIKSKLIAAICMLLVSSIMMVSSTYAWFTLSTAPEVTGITTAVGANGNLEMALMPTNGAIGSITNTTNATNQDWLAKNVTWGNLVDLSSSTFYGLDRLVLYPSQLNADIKDSLNNPTSLGDALLATPTYGSDGRINGIEANTVTGIYNSSTQGFYAGNEWGVRGVGVASGMTPRQLAFRNARSAADTARALAATLASQSLNANGSALANIAITHGMGNDDGKYTAANVASLRAIINDLQKEGGVLDQIETAYLQYILAFAASGASGTEDTVFNAISGAVSAEGATLSSVLTLLEQNQAELPAAFNAALNAFTNDTAEIDSIVEKVAAANTALAALETEVAANPDATFDWSEISAPMNHLANTSAITINGFAAGDIRDNLGDLVSSVTAQGGLRVIMGSGAGVYADIADQCGDYNASITIDRVEYNGIVLNNMNARMETNSTLPDSYLSALGTTVGTLPSPPAATTGELPISEFYGYVVDLVFRTNAAESNLLLQTDAADRIYSDNNNTETMGHGSTMTFQATTTDFSNEQVISLMSAIRIVFFNPMDANEVLATARLDTDNATITADGVTADIILYTTVQEYEVAENGEYAVVDGAYVKYADMEESAQTSYAGDRYNLVTREDILGDEEGESAVITALTQNTATAVSVLVYLDGNLVENADVAATASTSMTGSMNLQFASSATLVPMDYAGLNNSTPTTGD